MATELRGRVEPIIGVLGHRRRNHLGKRARHPSRNQIGGLVVEDLLQQRCHRRLITHLEWRMTSHQVINGGAQRIDVRFDRWPFALDHLRRRIPQARCHHPRLRLRCSRHPRNSKVSQLRLAILRHQHVRRFHITMNHPRVMSRMQRPRQLHRHLRRLRPRQRPITTHPITQRPRRHERHHHERLTGVQEASVEDRHYRRMLRQQPHCLTLTTKPLLRQLIEIGGVENLHRHRAPKRRLISPKDGRETTTTNLNHIFQTRNVQFHKASHSQTARWRGSKYPRHRANSDADLS